MLRFCWKTLNRLVWDANKQKKTLIFFHSAVVYIHRFIHCPSRFLLRVVGVLKPTPTAIGGIQPGHLSTSFIINIFLSFRNMFFPPLLQLVISCRGGQGHLVELDRERFHKRKTQSAKVKQAQVTQNQSKVQKWVNMTCRTWWPPHFFEVQFQV